MAYRGVTARIPVGSQGFTGTRNQSQAGPGHFIYTEGAELDGGIIRKDGGAKMLNAVLSPGSEGYELGLFTSQRHVLHFDTATEGDTVIKDDGFGTIGVWEAMNGAKQTLVDFKFPTASLVLNGTNQYVRASDFPSLAFGTQEFTFHCWFNCKVAVGSLRAAFGQTDNALAALTSSLYCRRKTTGEFEFAIANLGLWFVCTGTSQFSDTLLPGWHHLACVRDNIAGALKLFIDGHLEGQVAIGASVPVNDTAGYFIVGAVGDSAPSAFWQGNVDEFVQVFGKAVWREDFTPPAKPTPRAGQGAEEPWDQVTPIAAGINWSPSVGKREDVIYLLSGSGGSFLADPDVDGTFSHELTGLVPGTLDPPPYFCVGGGEVVGQPRKLFAFNAMHQVLYYPGGSTGRSMVPVGTPAADWTGEGNFPTFGCTHQQRMFVGGNASDPHRLYYSEVTDHTKFTGTGAGAAGTIPVYPGQGEKLVAAYSIRGALILWKYPVGIYVLTTQDPDPTTWQVEILSRTIGGLNANSIIQIENDVLFMDRNGAVHSLTATNDFGDFNTGDISEIAKLQPFMQDEVNRLMLHRAHSIYYTNKRQAWFFVPRKSATNPNLRLQLGLDTPQQQAQQTGFGPRFFMSRRDTAICSWMRPSPKEGIPIPVIGEDDGCIYLLDQPDRNKFGHAYPIEFSTANTDLSFVDQTLATRQKNGQFLEIVYEPEGEWDLLVDVFWDDHWNDMIAFNMGGAGVPLDVFMLDRDVLGASGVKEVRRRLIGSGRRFRMTARNDGLDQNVSIAEFHIAFTVGDERTPEGIR